MTMMLLDVDEVRMEKMELITWNEQRKREVVNDKSENKYRKRYQAMNEKGMKLKLSTTREVKKWACL